MAYCGFEKPSKLEAKFFVVSGWIQSCLQLHSMLTPTILLKAL